LHKSGKGAKYVRNKLPAELVYSKEYHIYKCAINEEKRMKTLNREQKSELIRIYVKKKRKIAEKRKHHDYLNERQ
jgi:predicted GIY-YIG superfamily endonuclease